jgi:hypothetical protein
MASDLWTKSDAVLSPCRLYRYTLTRVWEPALPVTCWVMLNPSTADAGTDDPTIRRCVNFSHGWGHGGIVVVNLYALRATDPRELLKVADPVGPENDQAIEDACAGNFTVVAWGAKAKRDRVKRVKGLLFDTALDVGCLGLTKEGHPRHPLYVPAAQALQKFSCSWKGGDSLRPGAKSGRTASPRN